MHDCFPNHINGDDKEGKYDTSQPASNTQALNAQNFAAEGHENKLEGKDGKHNPNESLIAAQAFKRIDVACSRIKTVKSDGHHKYCKHSRFQIGKINIAKQVTDRLHKQDAEAKKVIKVFADYPDLQVLNGRYGPYIASEGKNYKIPSGVEPADLTPEACFKVIELQKTKAETRKRKK